VEDIGVEDTGVTVTALMLGTTETNLFHRGGTDETDDTRIGASKKDNEAEIGRQVAGMECELFGRAGAGPRVADEEIAQATLQPVAVAAPQEDGVVGRARHRHGYPR